MNTRLRALVGAVLLAVLSAPLAFAWRARMYERYQDIPIVKSVDAAALPGAKSGITPDRMARGKGAVRLRAGGPTLSLTADLEVGYYSVWPYARCDAAAAAQRRGLPVYLEMVVRSPSGRVECSRQRVPYIEIYEPVTHLHLRAREKGTYTITLRACDGTTGSLLIDAIEVRDEMPGCARAPLKTAGGLIDYKLNVPVRTRKKLAGGPRPESAAELTKFYADLRASMPPLNALLGACDAPYTDELKALAKELTRPGFKPSPWYEPWAFVDEKAGERYDLSAYLAGKAYEGGLPDAGGGYFVHAGQCGVPAQRSAEAPQVTGHGEIGKASAQGRDLTIATLGPLFGARLNDMTAALHLATEDYLKSHTRADARCAALCLAVLADRAASLDPRAQDMIHNFGYWSFTRFARHNGSGVDYTALAGAYDALFEAIKDDAELARVVGTGIPWVRTPRDLTAFFDYTILQQGLVRHFRFMRQGMQTGWEQATLALVLALGHNDVSQRWMDRFMREEFADLTGNAGWADHLACGYNRDGCNSVGGTEYTKASATGIVMIARTLEVATTRGFRVPRFAWDPKTNGRLLEAGRWLLDFRAAGGFSSYFGEWSDCRTHARNPTYGYGEFQPAYLQLYAWTGDPRYARMVVAYGKGGLDEKTWRRMLDASKDVRMPVLAKQSVVMAGFGGTMLEMNSGTDDYTRKGAVLLRHGSGRGHAHGDLLDLSIDAYGYRVCADGGRAFWPFPRFTCQHCTVEIDRSSFQATGINSGAFGYNTLFKPLAGVQFASAGGWCSTHPQLKDYRRDVAMVECGPEDFYVFSVVRADGGKVHTYSFHASASDQWGTNCGEKPTDKDPLNLMDRCKDWRTGTTKDPTVIDWKLALGRANKDDVHLRHYAFGIGGLTFYMARGTGSYTLDVPFFWAERASATPLSDAYLSVTEPWKDKPNLRSVRQLVEAKGRLPVMGHDKAYTVEVVTASGRRDTIAAATPGHETRLTNGLEFDGHFAFVSEDDAGVVTATLVGGTYLRLPGKVSIKANRGEDRATIVGADFATRTLTSDVPLPGGSAGEHFQIGARPHLTSAYVDGIDGRRLTLRKDPLIFRSPIVKIDPAARAVYPFVQMPWTAAEPGYYDGCTATNEARSRFWKVRVEPVEMWMPLFSPVEAADVTDADGDGRRTVRLTNFALPHEVRDPVARFYGPFTRPVRWRQMNRAPFREPVVVEVTRVDVERRRLYFRPPTGDYDLLWHRWVYSGVTITNEAGTRQWRGNYAATDFRIVLLGGAAPTAADFADADGDGQARILLYDFGPGDWIRLETHVQVRRVGPHEYRVQAGTACSVDLGPGSKVTAGP